MPTMVGKMAWMRPSSHKADAGNVSLGTARRKIQSNSDPFLSPQKMMERAGYQATCAMTSPRDMRNFGACGALVVYVCSAVAGQPSATPAKEGTTPPQHHHCWSKGKSSVNEKASH